MLKDSHPKLLTPNSSPLTQLETIVALATPPGVGGIAVIRISGPQAFQVARQLHGGFRRALKHPRELVFGEVRAGKRLIDQGLVVAMPAPHSYTGEDVAELQLHGSTAAASEAIAAATQHGARLAEPGEFTKRAYLNGKLDLVQAEAVGELIAADTAAALRQAEVKASGVLSRQIEALRARLVKIIAELSANLDFGEEDIPDIDAGTVLADVERIKAEVEVWINGAKIAVVIRDGLKVAIVGLPNAGKSSLLNALLGYERAIVTEVAGTTRDTLEERITINGLGVVFVDTAGLRATGDKVEALGVERSQAASRAADLVLMVATPKLAGERLAEQVRVLEIEEQPVVAVAAKVDIENRPVDWPLTATREVRTSAKTGEGLDELRQAIYELGVGAVSAETAVITSGRQLASLRACALELDRALAALRDDAPIDVIAGELTLAAEALGGLLGESVPAEVINAIFANFCIGK